MPANGGSPKIIMIEAYSTDSVNENSTKQMTPHNRKPPASNRIANTLDIFFFDRNFITKNVISPERLLAILKGGFNMSAMFKEKLSQKDTCSPKKPLQHSPSDNSIQVRNTIKKTFVITTLIKP